MRRFVLFIIVSVLFAVIFFCSSVSSLNEPFKKKYAFCMMGQPRAIKSTIDNLYKNLIEQLDADMYILMQKTHTDLDNNLDLFNKNVIEKEIYEPSVSIRDKYKIINELKEPSGSNNYLMDANLQFYYNMHLINEKFGDALEKNYEYIIVTRSDFLYLLLFPDILNLVDLKEKIWTFDGHEWGGINATFLCIPSIYIKSVLSCYYNNLQNPDNVHRFNDLELNPEKFIKLIFDDNNWKIGKIQNISFLTADSENEIATWSKVIYDEEHKVHYKYKEQMDSAYESLSQYQKGYKWTYTHNEDFDKIILTQTTP